MNKRVVQSLVVMSVIGCQALYPVRILVDKIVGRVNGLTITRSQLETPQIVNNAKLFTFEQYAAHMLWYERAKERNMLPLEDEITRNVNQYKKDNDLADLPDDQVDTLLRGKIGIDLATYRKQIEQYFAVESLKSYEFRNRCSVGEAEVRAAYEARPIIDVARYTLEVVSLTPADVELWKKNEYVIANAAFDTCDSIAETDLAPHFKAVKQLAVGDAMVVCDSEGESTLVRLKAKQDAHKQTLTERYHAIELMLQRKKVEQYARESEQELYRNAVIRQF
jgi:hypothetical protein